MTSPIEATVVWYATDPPAPSDGFEGYARVAVGVEHAQRMTDNAIAIMTRRGLYLNESGTYGLAISEWEGSTLRVVLDDRFGGLFHDPIYGLKVARDAVWILKYCRNNAVRVELAVRCQASEQGVLPEGFVPDLCLSDRRLLATAVEVAAR